MVNVIPISSDHMKSVGGQHGAVSQGQNFTISKDDLKLMTLCRDFNASEVYLSLHRDAPAFWLPGPVLGARDGVRKDRLVSDSGAHIPVWEVEKQTRGYQHQRASAKQDFYRISEWETSPLKLGGQRRPLSEGDSSQTVKTKISTKKTL